MLDDILDTLTAPRRLLWGMVPGLHDQDTGDAYTGSQVAQNAFGTDPEGLWGKALGFGLEVAGDPLPALTGLAGRGLGAGVRALRGAAPAARAASGAERAVGALAHAGPAELANVGHASALREAGESLLRNQLVESHPEAGWNLLGSSLPGAGEHTGGALADMASRYNANRTMMLDALEEYGPGSSVLNDLGLRSDAARLGMTKKAINQESMLERAVRGDPRALRGGRRISGMRSKLAELGAPYSQDLARTDMERIARFLETLNPAQGVPPG